MRLAEEARLAEEKRLQEAIAAEERRKAEEAEKAEQERIEVSLRHVHDSHLDWKTENLEQRESFSSQGKVG